MKPYSYVQTVCLFVCFHGISTFVGYLMLNPFLYKLRVLFQTIQFNRKNISISSYLV